MVKRGSLDSSAVEVVLIVQPLRFALIVKKLETFNCTVTHLPSDGLRWHWHGLGAGRLGPDILYVWQRVEHARTTMGLACVCLGGVG